MQCWTEGWTKWREPPCTVRKKSIRNAMIIEKNYSQLTKKRRTWWCFTAPIKPMMDIISKNTPQATIPPMMGRLVTTLAALAYVATPIKMKLTNCYKKDKLLLRRKGLKHSKWTYNVENVKGHKGLFRELETTTHLGLIYLSQWAL